MKYQAYKNAVLAYFRSEWTDIPNNDENFKLLVSKELNKLIEDCHMGSLNVPNAADLVRMFLGFGQKARTREE